MSISGLLDFFDELPAYGALSRALRGKEQLRPLELPESARAATLARLYQDHDGPVVLLTGRVDHSVSWVQALESWLPQPGAQEPKLWFSDALQNQPMTATGIRPPPTRCWG